jgi:hypothetical protein
VKTVICNILRVLKTSPLLCKGRKVQCINLLLICLVLFLSGCGNNSSTRSFCWWQRTFRLSAQEQSILKATKANHLYIRYFDVDWNNTQRCALPVGTTIVESVPPCDFTPSVFITNKVFEHATQPMLDTLAIHIRSRVEMVNRQLLTLALKDSLTGNINAPNLIRQWTELLIDCDWTAGTRENYFYFLRRLEEQFPRKALSATLRLWQFKHRDISGIPPVNRCLLMCYNLSNPKAPHTANSIGSAKELDEYLTQSNYPHHLDVALPIFGWGVVFHNGKWLGLLGNADVQSFRRDTTHYKEVTVNRFVLQKDTVIGQHYLRYGDEIRMETIRPKELESMVKLIKKRLSLRSNSRLTLFSLDPHYVNQYGTEELLRIYSLFEH